MEEDTYTRNSSSSLPVEGADEGEVLASSLPGGKLHPRLQDGAAPSGRFPACENLPVGQRRQEMCGETSNRRAPSRRWRIPAATPLLLLAYLTYVLLGSAAFWALEGPAERDSAHHLLQEKWELLENHTCLNREALEQLVKGVVQAYKNGHILRGNASLGRWDFAGSFFFSISAVTTIGYGNLSPSTVTAQVFCIFFALFGIPLNLVLLNRIGQLMLSGVHHCAFLLGEKFHWQRGAAVLTRTCALVAGLFLFFLLPPMLFTAIEGWTFEEGFYYSFITLSTIGFGDYVIGMNPDRIYPTWYKNVVSLWILFGMAWLALIINLCISLLENSRDLCQCCKRESKGMGRDLMNSNQNISLEPEDGQNCSMKDTKPADTKPTGPD